MSKYIVQQFSGWMHRPILLAAQGLSIGFGLVAFARADTQTPSSPTAISLSTIGSAYTQNFDSLATTGTSSTLPTGWVILESGASASSSYTAGTGSGTTGDTYSFGVSGANPSSDRALGTLQTGSLISTLGATFTNNTSSAISSLDLAYRGELWRLGSTSGRTDELDFQYSTNATSLSSGTWSNASALNFVTPSTTGSVGARDGNASGNFSSLSSSLTGLSISNGTTFWIRWLDFDASGSDDGLAVDDFSLTPHSGGSIWTGGGGNNTWSTSSNWNSAPSNGANLIFAGTTRLSNSNDTLTSAGSITFDSTAGSFTLSGNALTTAGGITNNSTHGQLVALNLTLSAAQQLNAASGPLTVSGNIATGGNMLTITGSSSTTLSGAISGSGQLVKSGAGTLSVSGNNTFSGGTTVSAGILTVAHANALGSGALTINSSAQCTLQSGLSAPVQLAALTIQGGTSPIGTLDITDNDLIIHNGNLTTLTAQIKSGLNMDSTLWGGQGITSSNAAADESALTAVGIIPNEVDGSQIYNTWPTGADSGSGVSVSDSDVLIKYTYFGDADLNGVVDKSNDFLQWQAGFQSGGSLQGWLWGDFDYNGTVDSSTDLLLLQTSIGNQGAPLIGAGVQAVPEPATLMLAALGLTGLAIIARRRKSR